MLNFEKKYLHLKVIERIKQPISFEMELFEKKFRLSMSSKVALLNRITHYIVNLIFSINLSNCVPGVARFGFSLNSTKVPS